MLDYLSKTRQPVFPGFAHPARMYASLGRLLLLLASIVLIALPFTQQLWTWDHFLHGGQDFETTVLLILTTFCLVLVLVQCCKQFVKLLLTSLSWLLLPLRQPASTLPACFSIFSGDRPLGPPVAVYSRPRKN